MTLVWTPGFNGMTDADAIAYVNAVEAADGQLLEFGVGKAINDFVVGCKLDNTWNAIKASCILAGARTLTGALVPLVGTAPTNVGPFVSGDYNRKTGLVGDGSTKYLNSNRNNNVDPQNNFHVAAQVTTAHSANSNSTYIGAGFGVAGSTNLGVAKLPPSDHLFFRSRSTAVFPEPPVPGNGSTINFIGHSRSNATSIDIRYASATFNVALVSETPFDGNLLVFGRTVGGSYINGRLAFYSIGESLDLALLDTRVTTLINAFAAAIP
jgi:hypothetical protein